MDTKEVEVVQPNQLAVILKESGLEETKAAFILRNFQDYFKLADEWTIKARNIVVTSADQTAEMEMARAGRLFLRQKRLMIEGARKELKEQALREAHRVLKPGGRLMMADMMLTAPLPEDRADRIDNWYQ